MGSGRGGAEQTRSMRGEPGVWGSGESAEETVARILVMTPSPTLPSFLEGALHFLRH